MTSIYGMLHVYEIQRRVADNKLRGETEEADRLLHQKEQLSGLLDKMSQKKGDFVDKPYLAECRTAFANTKDALPDFNGEDPFAESKFDWAGGDKAWMKDTTKGDQRTNNDHWDDVMKTVQRAMDRVSDKLNALNSKMELYKSESQDAEARLSKGYSGIEAMLKELRQS